MKKALLLGVGLGLIVLVAIPFFVRKGDELPSPVAENEKSFLTPDYAKRLGLHEVSQEMFRSCPIGLSYEVVVERLGVPGVQLQHKDDLPPIPFEPVCNIWRRAIDHPEKDVYAWVSNRGEVMTITFRNGKNVHVYYGQDVDRDQ